MIVFRAAAVILAGLTLAAGSGGLTDVAPQLVEVPGGPFTMGADPARDPDAFDNERWPSPSGEGIVDVATFYIARHEVTVGAFSEFARSGWRVDPRALSGNPAHPVTLVSWPDALAYCRWLEGTLKSSASTPARVKDLLASGWHVTLPSEAEWEKAARGNDRRRYPWGMELGIPPRANFNGRATMPVGSFACPECAYGLSDMSGNVWEWTSSPYQPYPYDPHDDRQNLNGDALWVIRGGSFADPARLVRTTARGGADPGARRPFIGFRVAIVRR
jgi:formylglycine-generating enzyme required for sulfatase activity